jgi:hypothetical protein
MNFEDTIKNAREQCNAATELSETFGKINGEMPAIMLNLLAELNAAHGLLSTARPGSLTETLIIERIRGINVRLVNGICFFDKPRPVIPEGQLEEYCNHFDKLIERLDAALNGRK